MILFSTNCPVKNKFSFFRNGQLPRVAWFRWSVEYPVMDFSFAGVFSRLSCGCKLSCMVPLSKVSHRWKKASAVLALLFRTPKQMRQTPEIQPLSWKEDLSYNKCYLQLPALCMGFSHEVAAQDEHCCRWAVLGCTLKVCVVVVAELYWAALWRSCVVVVAELYWAALWRSCVVVAVLTQFMSLKCCSCFTSRIGLNGICGLCCTWWWLFPHLPGFGEKVQPFISHLHFFFFFFEWGD